MSPASRSSYSFRPDLPPAVKQGARPADRSRAVGDVESLFDAIKGHGDFLAAWDGGVIPGVRYTRVNGHDNRAKNHFQGIQRLRGGRFAVVSGGDSNEKASHIFVIELASRRRSGAWSSNLLRSSEPKAEDKVVAVVALDDKLWHAGGISVSGDILAVPIEDGGRSRIVFLDLSDPTKPRCFRDVGIRRSDRKATAVGLAKLENEHFVCAVFWKDRNIDFYASVSGDLAEGFHPVPALARLADKRGYQTINFVLERSGGAERLYLIGTENRSGGAPFFPDKDIADLYTVELPDDFFRAGGPDPNVEPGVDFVKRREFQCRDEFCNMDAAAGIHVDPAGVLNLYAAYHWRVDNMIRLTEFRSGRSPAKIEDIHDAWVELYEHPDFKGRRLTIIGARPADSRIADYATILVQGGRFNDRVSSARWQIPDSHIYQLYDQPGFGGLQFTLQGDGRVQQTPDFRDAGYNDRVSSSEYVRL